MKRLIILALIAAAAGFSGCCTMDYTVSPSTGNEHVLVSNYGWKLFNCIPLACGNATDPQSAGYFGPWAFFRDDVTMDKIQARMATLAAAHGKTPANLFYHNYDTVFISIPFTDVPIPIPYVVCYHEIQLSGVLK